MSNRRSKNPSPQRPTSATARWAGHASLNASRLENTRPSSAATKLQRKKANGNNNQNMFFSAPSLFPLPPPPSTTTTTTTSENSPRRGEGDDDDDNPPLPPSSSSSSSLLLPPDPLFLRIQHRAQHESDALSVQMYGASTIAARALDAITRGDLTRGNSLLTHAKLEFLNAGSLGAAGLSGLADIRKSLSFAKQLERAKKRGNESLTQAKACVASWNVSDAEIHLADARQHFRYAEIHGEMGMMEARKLSEEIDSLKQRMSKKERGDIALKAARRTIDTGKIHETKTLLEEAKDAYKEAGLVRGREWEVIERINAHLSVALAAEDARGEGGEAAMKCEAALRGGDLKLAQEQIIIAKECYERASMGQKKKEDVQRLIVLQRGVWQLEKLLNEKERGDKSVLVAKECHSRLDLEETKRFITQAIEAYAKAGSFGVDSVLQLAPVQKWVEETENLDLLREGGDKCRLEAQRALEEDKLPLARNLAGNAREKYKAAQWRGESRLSTLVELEEEISKAALAKAVRRWQLVYVSKAFWFWYDRTRELQSETFERRDGDVATSAARAALNGGKYDQAEEWLQKAESSYGKAGDKGVMGLEKVAALKELLAVARERIITAEKGVEALEACKEALRLGVLVRAKKKWNEANAALRASGDAGANSIPVLEALERQIHDLALETVLKRWLQACLSAAFDSWAAQTATIKAEKTAMVRASNAMDSAKDALDTWRLDAAEDYLREARTALSSVNPKRAATWMERLKESEDDLKLFREQDSCRAKGDMMLPQLRTAIEEWELERGKELEKNVREAFEKAGKQGLAGISQLKSLASRLTARLKLENCRKRADEIATSIDDMLDDGRLDDAQAAIEECNGLYLQAEERGTAGLTHLNELREALALSRQLEEGSDDAAAAAREALEAGELNQALALIERAKLGYTKARKKGAVLLLQSLGQIAQSLKGSLDKVRMKEEADQTLASAIVSLDAGMLSDARQRLEKAMKMFLEAGEHGTAGWTSASNVNERLKHAEQLDAYRIAGDEAVLAARSMVAAIRLDVPAIRLKIDSAREAYAKAESRGALGATKIEALESQLAEAIENDPDIRAGSVALEAAQTAAISGAPGELERLLSEARLCFLRAGGERGKLGLEMLAALEKNVDNRIKEAAAVAAIKDNEVQQRKLAIQTILPRMNDGMYDADIQVECLEQLRQLIRNTTGRGGGGGSRKKASNANMLRSKSGTSGQNSSDFEGDTTTTGDEGGGGGGVGGKGGGNASNLSSSSAVSPNLTAAASDKLAKRGGRFRSSQDNAINNSNAEDDEEDPIDGGFVQLDGWTGEEVQLSEWETEGGSVSPGGVSPGFRDFHAIELLPPDKGRDLFGNSSAVENEEVWPLRLSVSLPRNSSRGGRVANNSNTINNASPDSLSGASAGGFLGGGGAGAGVTPRKIVSPNLGGVAPDTSGIENQQQQLLDSANIAGSVLFPSLPNNISSPSSSPLIVSASGTPTARRLAPSPSGLLRGRVGNNNSSNNNINNNGQNIQQQRRFSGGTIIASADDDMISVVMGSGQGRRGPSSSSYAMTPIDSSEFLPSVIRSMVVHAQDVRVIRAATELIGELRIIDPTTCPCSDELTTVVCTAFDTHLTDHRTTHSACAAVAVLMASSRQQASVLVDQGIISKLLKAMRSCPADALLQSRACRSLVPIVARRRGASEALSLRGNKERKRKKKLALLVLANNLDHAINENNNVWSRTAGTGTIPEGQQHIHSPDSEDEWSDSAIKRSRKLSTASSPKFLNGEDDANNNNNNNNDDSGEEYETPRGAGEDSGGGGFQHSQSFNRNSKDVSRRNSASFGNNNNNNNLLKIGGGGEGGDEAAGSGSGFGSNNTRMMAATTAELSALATLSHGDSFHFTKPPERRNHQQIDRAERMRESALAAVSAAQGEIAMVEAMRLHPNNVSLHCEVLNVLRWLMDGSVESTFAVVQADGISIIVQAMRTLPRLRAQMLACECLSLLAEDDASTSRSITLSGGIFAAIRLMETVASPRAYEAACALLDRIASSSLENRSEVHAAGGAGAVIAAMLEYHEDSALQAAACRAIASLSRREKAAGGGGGVGSHHAVVVGDAGGINTVLTALRQFGSNARVQREAMRALFHLLDGEAQEVLNSAAIAAANTSNNNSGNNADGIPGTATSAASGSTRHHQQQPLASTKSGPLSSAHQQQISSPTPRSGRHHHSHRDGRRRRSAPFGMDPNNNNGNLSPAASPSRRHTRSPMAGSSSRRYLDDGSASPTSPGGGGEVSPTSTSLQENNINHSPTSSSAAALIKSNPKVSAAAQVFLSALSNRRSSIATSTVMVGAGGGALRRERGRDRRGSVFVGGSSSPSRASSSPKLRISDNGISTTTVVVGMTDSSAVRVPSNAPSSRVTGLHKVASAAAAAAKSNSAIVMKSNGVQAVIRGMREHAAVVSVQEQGLRVLNAMLISKTVPTARLLEDILGIPVVMHALTNHFWSNVVQQNGCAVLAHLGKVGIVLSQSVDETTVAATLRAVLHSMREQENDPALQLRACSALAMITPCVNQQKVRSKVIVRVLEAIRLHGEKSCAFYIAASNTLAEVCDTQTTATEIHSIVEAIAAGLSVHHRDPAATIAGCRALCKLLARTSADAHTLHWEECINTVIAIGRGGSIGASSLSVAGGATPRSAVGGGGGGGGGGTDQFAVDSESKFFTSTAAGAANAVSTSSSLFGMNSNTGSMMGTLAGGVQISTTTASNNNNNSSTKDWSDPPFLALPPARVRNAGRDRGTRLQEAGLVGCSEPVLAAVLSFIGALPWQPAIAHKSTAMAAAFLALDGFHNFPTSGSICMSACHAISSLCFGFPEIRKAALEQGALESVVRSCMRAFPLEADVQERALAAFINLSFTRGSAGQLIAAAAAASATANNDAARRRSLSGGGGGGGVSASITLITPAATRMIKDDSAALFNTSPQTIAAVELAAKAAAAIESVSMEAAEAITVALRAHPGRSQLKIWGCQALRNLSATRKGREAVYSSGAVSTVLGAMWELPQIPAVQANGCGVLSMAFLAVHVEEELAQFSGGDSAVGTKGALGSLAAFREAASSPFQQGYDDMNNLNSNDDSTNQLLPHDSSNAVGMTSLLGSIDGAVNVMTTANSDASDLTFAVGSSSNINNPAGAAGVAEGGCGDGTGASTPHRGLPSPLTTRRFSISSAASSHNNSSERLVIPLTELSGSKPDDLIAPTISAAAAADPSPPEPIRKSSSPKRNRILTLSSLQAASGGGGGGGGETPKAESVTASGVGEGGGESTPSAGVGGGRRPRMLTLSSPASTNSPLNAPMPKPVSRRRALSRLFSDKLFSLTSSATNSPKLPSSSESLIAEESKDGTESLTGLQSPVPAESVADSLGGFGAIDETLDENGADDSLLFSNTARSSGGNNNNNNSLGPILPSPLGSATGRLTRLASHRRQSFQSSAGQSMQSSPVESVGGKESGSSSGGGGGVNVNNNNNNSSGDVNNAVSAGVAANSSTTSAATAAAAMAAAIAAAAAVKRGKELLELGAVDAALVALNTHPDDEDVVEQACSVLRAAGSCLGAAPIADAIGAVVSSLKKHLSSDRIAEACTAILYIVCAARQVATASAAATASSVPVFILGSRIDEDDENNGDDKKKEEKGDEENNNNEAKPAPAQEEKLQLQMNDTPIDENGGKLLFGSPVPAVTPTSGVGADNIFSQLDDVDPQRKERKSFPSLQVEINPEITSMDSGLLDTFLLSNGEFAGEESARKEGKGEDGSRGWMTTDASEDRGGGHRDHLTATMQSLFRIKIGGSSSAAAPPDETLNESIPSKAAASAGTAPSKSDGIALQVLGALPNSSSVHENVLGILSLISSPEEARSLGDTVAVGARVLESMLRFPRHAGVQSRGCLAMAALATVSPSSARNMAKSGGISAAVNVLRNFHSSATAQMAGMAALWNVGASANVIDRDYGLEEAHLSLQALRVGAQQSPFLSEVGLRLLAALGQQDELAQQIFTRETVEILSMIARSHRRNPLVQLLICNLLVVLASGVVAAATGGNQNGNNNVTTVPPTPDNSNINLTLSNSVSNTPAVTARGNNNNNNNANNRALAAAPAQLHIEIDAAAPGPSPSPPPPQKGLGSKLAEFWLRNSIPYDIVCHAMRSHPGNAAVQASACHALSLMVRPERGSSAEPGASIVPALSNSLHLHASNLSVQDAAMRALASIAKGSRGRQAIADAALIPVIVERLRGAAGESSIVAAHTCALIWNLATDSTFAEILCVDGAVPEIAAALERHLHDAYVQAMGAGALASLFIGDTRSVSAAIACRVAERLIHSMTLHSSSSRVHAASIRALGNLAHSEAGRVAVAELKPFVVIAKCLKTAADDAELQASGAWFALQMSISPGECRKELLAVDMISILSTAGRIHGRSSEVGDLCHRALAGIKGVAAAVVTTPTTTTYVNSHSVNTPPAATPSSSSNNNNNNNKTRSSLSAMLSTILRKGPSPMAEPSPRQGVAPHSPQTPLVVPRGWEEWKE